MLLVENLQNLTLILLNCQILLNQFHSALRTLPGIEFKDFNLGFRQSTFLCTTLKCIEKFRIPFIKSGIPASNLGSSEARNPAKFAACLPLRSKGQLAI